jgi:hypothetical protein
MRLLRVARLPIQRLCNPLEKRIYFFPELNLA